jgi:catechol 2,3-dioxygenase-like lactoylglutathione lyase family enzyme
LLISKVTLYSSAIDELKHFYVKELGFKLIDSKENSFKIKVGESELEFQEDPSNRKPFYHFAFNIPANQFKEAKNWAKTKVILNIEEGSDEVYFKHSDAHSFYFLDPSDNIVEFISRQSLSPKSNTIFSPLGILNISEINITPNDVLSCGNQLIDFGIPVRDGDSLEESLNFMGSNGAFLLLGSEKRKWFFSDKEAEIHPLTIEIDEVKIIKVDELGNVKLSLL